MIILTLSSSSPSDSNGRQNVKRFRNSRIDYDISNATLEEPVASNYYPINSWISMKGGLIFEITISRKNLFIFIFIDYTSNKWLSIVTDRSSGAASITNDTLEVMIHRRLLGM